MIKKTCIGIVFWMCIATVWAQDSTDTTQKKFPIIPVEVGLLAASQVGLSFVWYDDFGAFTFRDDLHQWLGMDKLGHAMSAYQVARSNRILCEYAGLNAKKAQRWSAVSTAVFYTGIEVLDGFSKTYGFSWSDFAANTVGIGLASLPHTYQQRFSLKFSYQPTNFAALRPEILGQTGLERAFKDYNGQTYWLSLWQTQRKRWYHFVGISVGYGATGMYGGSNNPAFNAAGAAIPPTFRARQLYFALDFNWEGLAPNKPKVQKWLRLLDFIKVPLPGVVWQEAKGVSFLPVAY